MTDYIRQEHVYVETVQDSDGKTVILNSDFGLV